MPRWPSANAESATLTSATLKTTNSSLRKISQSKTKWTRIWPSTLSSKSNREIRSTSKSGALNKTQPSWPSRLLSVVINSNLEGLDPEIKATYSTSSLTPPKHKSLSPLLSAKAIRVAARTLAILPWFLNLFPLSTPNWCVRPSCSTPLRLDSWNQLLWPPSLLHPPATKSHSLRRSRTTSNM